MEIGNVRNLGLKGGPRDISQAEMLMNNTEIVNKSKSYKIQYLFFSIVLHIWDKSVNGFVEWKKGTSILLALLCAETKEILLQEVKSWENLQGVPSILHLSTTFAVCMKILELYGMLPITENNGKT